jgi:transcriptional regulator with XRE-family HTH domain
MIKDPLINLSKLICLTRDKSEISVEQLAREAKVSIQHVANIEAADRKALPEGTYLYGYLKKILKTLNFDNYEKMLDDYKEAEASFVLQQMLMETGIEEMNAKEDAISFNNYFSIKHLLIVFGILILILGLVILRFKFLDSFNNKTLKGDKILLPEHSKSSLLNSKITEIDETKPELPKPNPKVIYGGSGKLHLRLLVAQSTWLRILAVKQSTIVFQGYVSPAKIAILELSDDEGFELSCDNAAALMVDTGKKTYVLGNKGQNLQWYYPKSARAIYRHRQRENSRKPALERG